ncbi:MAG: hypothetical protein M1833_007139 [Piccolia ochrophora]|nr:MAG: hypothetical protein M1833_007139 [Piccolia ochrophora]
MASHHTNATDGGQPLEKDWSARRENHLGPNENSIDALHRIKTAGSISISPELFEKIYLSPQNAVKGDLRKTFGNPTPLALLGFLLSLSPLSCDLMGWRGAGGNGAASIGVYMFMGGLLMIIGGVMEFIIGNTFPFVVFCSFGVLSYLPEGLPSRPLIIHANTSQGGFWLAFGSTLQPFYNAYGAYSPDPSKPAEGLESPAFAASFGPSLNHLCMRIAFFLLFMGLLCFIYLICSLRTNIVFVVIFLSLVIAFSMLAGAYWQLAMGNAVAAGRLQKGGGGCTFVTSMAGWYLFAAQMLAALDFPFSMPVGDLSRMIKGASERNAPEV